MTLEDLREEEFKQLKWLLQQADIMHTLIPHLEVHPAIPVARLEMADRQDTVVQMMRIYGSHGALEVTRKVLIKINRNDLVQQLSNITSAPKGTLWELIIMRCVIAVIWLTCAEAHITFLSLLQEMLVMCGLVQKTEKLPRSNHRLRLLTLSLQTVRLKVKVLFDELVLPCQLSCCHCPFSRSF